MSEEPLKVLLFLETGFRSFAACRTVKYNPFFESQLAARN